MQRKPSTGSKFCNWTKLLHEQLSAEVLTNDVVSKAFKISRGCPQGSPLSPLLFILAIEPLVIAVRTHKHIHGIQVGSIDNRISLFADDVILFLKRLDSSIPALLELIGLLGKISGYKINTSKSSIMVLNKEEEQNPSVHILKFKLSENFTYLGINIARRLDRIVSINYEPVMESVAQSIDRWMSLPISLIGRINILKMNILPKFVYLFQSIPLAPPTYLFSRMRKLFTRFIWNKRHPRIRLSLIYLPFDRGGLIYPNTGYTAENNNVLLFNGFPSVDGYGIKLY